MIRTMSNSPLTIADVNLQNFGVALAFCHTLMTGAQRAAVATQALKRGQFFRIYLNDGYCPADDWLMLDPIYIYQSQISKLLLELLQS